LGNSGLITRIPGKNRYRLAGDGLRFAIFYTKLHDRLLRPLLAADQPPAPPQLRKSLQTIDIHITETIDQAPPTAKSRLKTQDNSQSPSDQGSLRRSRDCARQRWPFGQFHRTRAGGFVGWAGLSSDEFSLRYSDLVTGSYDCVDRIVLNAFFPLGHNPGGFRTWWRRWHGDSDTELDNTHLMRMAGRFARRVKAWGAANGVPVIFCTAGERKHRIAEAYLATHEVVDLDEQHRSGFGYGFAVYQLEYSRNLIFADGATMQRVFDTVVDRTRSRLDVPKIRTIFGTAQRPRRTRKHSSMIEAAIETPTFDLTVFKLHFGRLTGKAYTKGERVLRFEAIAHNTAELRCGRMIEKFPEIVTRLAGIVERFATALDCVDTGFLGDGILDELPTGVRLGATRVGGVDLSKTRMRDALRAALALAPAPNGFTVAEFAARVHSLTGVDHCGYSIRQAAYDLRKLRGKQLVNKPGRARRYHVPPLAARTIAAPAHPPRPGHHPDPRRDPQPEDGTQTRTLDPRRPRLRTDPHSHANALQRSRHRNAASRLMIRHQSAIPHHQQIVGSRSPGG